VVLPLAIASGDGISYRQRSLELHEARRGDQTVTKSKLPEPPYSHKTNQLFKQHCDFDTQKLSVVKTIHIIELTKGIRKHRQDGVRHLRNAE
jgi:hypothetical protein